MVTHQAHNLEIEGSTPSRATISQASGYIDANIS